MRVCVCCGDFNSMKAVLICSNYMFMCVIMQGSPAVLLSSLNTDAVCERLRQLEGIDPNMLPQYTSTIKKVRV